MFQIAIKIILTIFFITILTFIIWKIWTHEIDIVKWLKKPSEFIPIKEKTIRPNIVPSIMLLPSKYKPGVEVEGIIWKKEFETHILKIKNNSESTGLFDLRIEIELPGAIIRYKMLENNGSQDLTLSQSKLPAGIREKATNLWSENIEYCTNNLSINVAKLFPMAKFSINILLSHIVKDHGGTIAIKYRYLLPDGKTNKESVVYPIEFMKAYSNQLHIDTEKPITEKYEGHFLFVPKKTLLFGPNGKVRQKE
jgi:hypothetical protein